jgi:hypothetical protein
MSAKQEPKDYIQKLEEFGAAVKEKDYDSKTCENAKDFIDTFAKRMGGMVNIAATVAKRDSTRAQELKNQDYRDAIGIEPFADIDTKNPGEVQKVAGDLVIECFENRVGGQEVR